MLLVLVVLGGAQQLQNPVGALNGVSAVDRQILTVQRLQMVPENLGVGLFLLGSEPENESHRLQFLLLADSGGKFIAVPGLTFSGKGAEKTFGGLTVLKGDGHGGSSFIKTDVRSMSQNGAKNTNT